MDCANSSALRNPATRRRIVATVLGSVGATMFIAHTLHKMIVVRGIDVSIKESLNQRMTLRSYGALKIL